MTSEETNHHNGDIAPEENSSSVLSQPNDEQKREIAKWISEGMGLSDVQKKINQDYGIVMTYIDVRFLVDDLDLTLMDEEDETPTEDETNSPEDTSLDSTADEPPGGVQVELDPVTPPGAMAGGSVVFSDGERKTWTIDQMGRLALLGGSEEYKPSEEDIVTFQKELDNALRGKGF